MKLTDAKDGRKQMDDHTVRLREAIKTYIEKRYGRLWAPPKPEGVEE